MQDNQNQECHDKHILISLTGQHVPILITLVLKQLMWSNISSHNVKPHTRQFHLLFLELFGYCSLLITSGINQFNKIQYNIKNNLLPFLLLVFVLFFLILGKGTYSLTDSLTLRVNSRKIFQHTLKEGRIIHYF